MRTKNNREYKTYAEKRYDNRYEFFFYTDDGQERDVSPLFRTDFGEEGIQEAWDCFKGNYRIDHKTSFELLRVFIEPDENIREEENKASDELEKLPKAL